MRATYCRVCMNRANLDLDDGPVYGIEHNGYFVAFCSNEHGQEYIQQFTARSAGGEATQTQGNPPPARLNKGDNHG